jgi:hypothetical protein
MALIAVLLGILFLYLYMKTYDFKMAPQVVMAGDRLSLAASRLLSGV